MKQPRTFRQALAEEAGAELGRGLGMLPAVALFAALAIGPLVADAWLYDREERRYLEARAALAKTADDEQLRTEPETVPSDQRKRRLAQRRTRDCS